MTKTTREQAKERRIEISSVVAKWFDLDPMSDGASQESLVDSIEHLLEKEREALVEKVREEICMACGNESLIASGLPAIEHRLMARLDTLKPKEKTK